LSREYFLSLFFQEGLNPHIAARSPHPDIVRTMVANQYGYALFNARPKNDAALDGKKLQVVPLKGPYRPMASASPPCASPAGRAPCRVRRTLPHPDQPARRPRFAHEFQVKAAPIMTRDPRYDICSSR
jgi:hypothetical protein